MVNRTVYFICELMFSFLIDNFWIMANWQILLLLFLIYFNCCWTVTNNVYSIIFPYIFLMTILLFIYILHTFILIYIIKIYFIVSKGYCNKLNVK